MTLTIETLNGAAASSQLAESFTPSTTSVASSLVLTAFLGLLPLAFFFVLLGAFKVKTHVCAIASLGVAVLVAIFGFGMPVDLTLLSATQGAAFGIFPIVYIVVMAVWLYNLTERTGRSEDVRAVFAAVGRGDMRVQALLIGFCFCGLIEGLAGFGAPVAISCAMLLALGLPPLKAALVTMVGNALNVCFGAMSIPVTTAAKLGGAAPDAVGATQGASPRCSCAGSPSSSWRSSTAGAGSGRPGRPRSSRA